MDSGNGLAANRRQDILCNNDQPVYWHIYAKRPLKINGRLANRRLTSLVKEATGYPSITGSVAWKQACHCQPWAPQFPVTQNMTMWAKVLKITWITLQYSLRFLGLTLLTLSWDKNWDSHSLVNGYPSFFPRIALVAPSPDGSTPFASRPSESES